MIRCGAALDAAARRELVTDFAADNALLSRLTGRLTGRDFSDWLGAQSRGQFGNRATVDEPAS